MKISKIHARQILDSKGNPTVEADVILEDGSLGTAAIPSGASTGTHEALELRDGDPKIYQGRGVLMAVENVNSQIDKLLNGYTVTEQEKIDRAMIDLDGTPNKSKLGANAILAVSLAVSKAAAISQKRPLFEYYHQLSAISPQPILPLPMMNIINGGQHANFSTDIQEFMIMPVGASSFSEALRMGSEVFHTLGKVLKEKGYLTTVGDEGGYAPQVKNGNGEAMDLILEAIKQAGYSAPDDFVLALDVASSELLKNGYYQLKTEGVEMDSVRMINFLSELTKKYPVLSIEDGLDQEDWEGWKRMNQELGEKIQLVGDDLLVTNVEFLQRAIDEKACNAILIKPNQIGTLTETIKAVELARRAGFKAIISNRSGETEDTTITHMAVGLGTGQIKTGSLSRGERTAKYNELLRIEEMLGDKAEYAGKSALQMKGIRHG